MFPTLYVLLDYHLKLDTQLLYTRGCVSCLKRGVFCTQPSKFGCLAGGTRAAFFKLGHPAAPPLYTKKCEWCARASSGQHLCFVLLWHRHNIAFTQRQTPNTLTFHRAVLNWLSSTNNRVIPPWFRALRFQLFFLFFIQITDDYFPIRLLFEKQIGRK